ncbi:MAG: polyprenyl synthetase family protein [Clostridia bacterium]|nr:polyprenyl synthetase family protein [Clostridia bacterium]
MIDFEKRSAEYVEIINKAVSEYVSEKSFGGRESSGLELMLKAMAYSLENGGKRIRPMLTLEFCRVCGGDYMEALPLAVGVEMIHTYSLIHDDLPCMDDDDMRRGKPSSHKVFGEANALLAGDSLLTLAFETVLSAPNLSGEAKTKAGLELAKAAGCSGMIAGQVMDLANEGRAASLDEVKATDRRKTGKLIKVSAVLGCIAAGADEEKIKAAEKYCENIGLAFQIVDDILDVTSDEETLGKPIGSDSQNEKSTYVSLLGLEESARYASELTENAKKSLEIFGSEGEFLIELADRLFDRKN